MLLIAEQGEEKLAKALEVLRAEPKTTRCIHLQFGAPLTTEFKDVIFTFAQNHFSDIDAHVYVCQDGSVFVIASPLPSKNAHEFMLAIGGYLNRPVEDSWADFCELILHANKLLLNVEQKINTLKKAELMKRKLQEQQEHERKRHSILNQAILEYSTTISTRRMSRDLPEFMMIEDDIFSSKLVENVLQKKYAMNSIKEVTHALDNYARIAPDLLFLDINLPDVTGHELLERILAMDPDAYVVMLSGNADQNNIRQAMSKGAKGFIAKPFTKEKIFQYIDRCPGVIAKQGMIH